MDEISWLEIVLPMHMGPHVPSPLTSSFCSETCTSWFFCSAFWMSPRIPGSADLAAAGAAAAELDGGDGEVEGSGACVGESEDPIGRFDGEVPLFTADERSGLDSVDAGPPEDTCP